MGQMEYNNSITTYIHGFDKLFALPLDKAILRAEADVLEPMLKRSLKAEKLVKSGRLSSDIGRNEKHTGKYGFSIILGPSGVHHRYVSKNGRANELRSGHLGYMMEYGLPGRNIRGRKWMTKAIEQSQAQAFDAAEKVMNKFLEECNL